MPYGPAMKTGLFLPLFGDLAEPRCVVELATSAEDAGWDGFFVWDHIFGQDEPVCDAFVALAAVAAMTKRIRLGPLVTPLARRRPWVLARQTTSVDHLSEGRLVLGIGLADDGWRSEPDRASRAGRRGAGEPGAPRRGARCPAGPVVGQTRLSRRRAVARGLGPVPAHPCPAAADPDLGDEPLT